MSLVDRTNETIKLSLHTPAIVWSNKKGEWVREESALLEVNRDQDSSIHPEPWVYLQAQDADEEMSPVIQMTYEEAELLWQRLGLILGKP